MNDDDQDHPLLQDKIDLLYETARYARIYYEALIQQDLPGELAAQMTRDWHATQIAPRSAIIIGISDPLATARAVREELIRRVQRDGDGSIS